MSVARTWTMLRRAALSGPAATVTRRLLVRQLSVIDDFKRKVQEESGKEKDLREAAGRIGEQMSSVGEATQRMDESGSMLPQQTEGALGAAGEAAKKVVQERSKAAKAAEEAARRLQADTAATDGGTETASADGAGATSANHAEGEATASPEDFVNSYKRRGTQALGLMGAVRAAFVENVRMGWKELTGEVKQSSVRVIVGSGKRDEDATREEPDAAEDRVDPSAPHSDRTDLVLTDSGKSAWQVMSERLKNAPIIKGVLKSGRAVYRDVADSAVGQGAKKVTDAVGDRLSDAREAWETSQNPIVYRLSSVWDSLTSETEEGYALRELRRLDSAFDPDRFRVEVTEDVAPSLLAAYLKGAPRELREWCDEGIYGRISEETKARKAEGLEMDQTILDVEQGEILAMKVEEGSGPTIVLQFMAQQIHCVRKRETGEVIEGAEDEIKAFFYALAFSQKYDEENSEIRYVVTDFLPIGNVPYY